MKVSSNRIEDIRKFMLQYLHGLYPVEEVNALFFTLINFYLGLSKSDILAKKKENISESELLVIYNAIKELKSGKPVQYIMKQASFYGMDFFVNKYVLIPRGETEELVDMVIKNIDNNSPRILEVGTGSGCIAVALKKNIPSACISAIDVSFEALDIAKKNGQQMKVEIEFIQMDFLDISMHEQLGTFDVIVSNPPYVTNSEKRSMHVNVLDFEPHTALFVPDEDPLIFYNAIFNFASRQPNCGQLYCEINESKSSELLWLAKSLKLENVVIQKDIHGKDRFVVMNNAKLAI